MNILLENFEALRAFLEAGGPVLWVIGVLAAFMGFLIFERLWFIHLVFPRSIASYQLRWQQRSETASWEAHRIRDAMISEARMQLSRMLPTLKILVALCPLLGLMGTVTGMIHVFDVVAALGTGNARAMASGIWRATIPTMAGLVVALPGLYFMVQLEYLSKQRVERLADGLRPQTG